MILPVQQGLSLSTHPKGIFSRGETTMRDIIRVALFVAALALPISSASGFTSGFCENRGQVDGQVSYCHFGSYPMVYFLHDRIVADLEGHALHLRLVDCSQGVTLEGRGVQESRYNFFLGNDQDHLATGVRTFSEVIYRDFRPGLDLVFRYEGERLAYEVVATRGQDSRVMADSHSSVPLFACEGAERVYSGPDGEMRFETPAGTLVDYQPAGNAQAGCLRIERAGAEGTSQTPDASAASPPLETPGAPDAIAAALEPLADMISRDDPAAVRVRIFDAAGRQVAAVSDAVLKAGTHLMLWDGRDGAGRPVESGTYFVRAELGDRMAEGKVVVVR
jgi:hypothetical protein